MWTGFIWLRTWFRCGLLLTLTLIIRVIKRKFMIRPTPMRFSTIALLPWFQQSQFRDLQFSRPRKFRLRQMGCDALWDAVYGPTYSGSAFLHFCVWIVTIYSTLKKEAWDFDDSCHNVISQNTSILIKIRYEIIHISDLKFISCVSYASFSVSLPGNTGFCHYLPIMINFVNCNWVDTRWQ